MARYRLADVNPTKADLQKQLAEIQKAESGFYGYTEDGQPAGPGGVPLIQVAPTIGSNAEHIQRIINFMDQYGVNDMRSLPMEVQRQIPGVISDTSSSVVGGLLSSPAFLLAAGGVAGMYGGAAGAGAAGAEEAAMLTGSGVGGGGATTGAGTAAAGAGAGVADAAWGVNPASGAAGGAVSDFGALGSTGATGAVNAGGAAGGGSVASSGFLGLSTGDWVNLGTQLGSSLLQSQAAKSAAADQTAASNAAIGESRRQYDQTRADLMPWLQQGTAAVGRLGDLLGTSGRQLTPEQVMEMSPGYQFRLAEGNKAINNAAGSRGMMNSGQTLKALTRFGQDYASNEYGNIYNRLAGLAGTGQTAGTNLGSFGASNANTIGGYMTGAANARGAARIGAANAYGGALSNIGNYYSQNEMLDRILKDRSNRTYGGGY